MTSPECNDMVYDKLLNPVRECCCWLERSQSRFAIATAPGSCALETCTSSYEVVRGWLVCQLSGVKGVRRYTLRRFGAA